MPDDDGKPTFDELKDALMPPGADSDALWAALKGAHRAGGYVPGRPAPDISFGAGEYAPESSGLLPPRSVGTGYPFRIGPSEPPLTPPDPFTKGSEAAGAFAEMYEDLLGAGVPLASVERILGAMLAVYGLMTKDEP